MKTELSEMTRVETDLDNSLQSTSIPGDDSCSEQNPAYAETLDFDNLPFLLSSLDLTTEPRIA